MFGNIFKSKEQKALEKILNDEDNLRRYGPKSTYPDLEVYKKNAMKLKSIYDNSDNNELVNFIRNNDNVGDFKGLFTQLGKASLSTLVQIAPGATKESIVDDVSLVQSNSSNRFNPQNIEELEKNPSLLPLPFLKDDQKALAVFTNKKSIEITHKQQNDPSTLYPQLVQLDYIVFHSLINLDGLMVFDGGAAFFIPKKILIDNFDIIQSSCENHKLNKLAPILFVFDK